MSMTWAEAEAAVVRRPRVEMVVGTTAVLVAFPRTAAQLQELAQRAEREGGALRVKYGRGHQAPMPVTARQRRANDAIFERRGRHGARAADRPADEPDRVVYRRVPAVVAEFVEKLTGTE